MYTIFSFGFFGNFSKVEYLFLALILLDDERWQCVFFVYYLYVIILRQSMYDPHTTTIISTLFVLDNLFIRITSSLALHINSSYIYSY